MPASGGGSARQIDLRSDTVTQPTPEMRRVMAEAAVGDDVYGEDPTVNELERVAAERLGKEAAVFVASGTMANLVAGLTHCERGTELICGADAHLLINEVGGVATLGGVVMRNVPNDRRGLLDPAAVEAAVRPVTGMFPRTSLVCLENTHNRGNGAAFTAGEIGAVAEVAHAHGIPVHVDGARIFNASVALGVPPAELAAPADSISFCLSKGLSCPVGSLLAGSREFVERARRTRKIVGGGMRQAGIIAAAGLWALDHLVDRLADDHANARRLAEGLAQLPGVEVDPSHIETNICYVALTDAPAAEVVPALRARGVLVNGMADWMRFVTHRGINAEDIDEALEAVEAVVRGAAPVL